MLSSGVSSLYFEILQALAYTLGTIRQLHGQLQGCREGEEG